MHELLAGYTFRSAQARLRLVLGFGNKAVASHTHSKNLFWSAQAWRLSHNSFVERWNDVRVRLDARTVNISVPSFEKTPEFDNTIRVAPRKMNIHPDYRHPVNYA